MGWIVSLGGLLLNGVTPQGAVLKALDVENWSAGAGIRGPVTPNGYASGGWIGEAFDESVRYIVPGTVKGESAAVVRAGVEALQAAIPRRTLAPLTVVEDGVTRSVWVRLDEVAPDIEWVTDTLVSFTLQLVAPDSRKLAGDGSARYSLSQAVGLPFTSGGLQLPASVPFQIAAVVVSGSVTLTNAGNARPPVLVTFTGPVSNPVLRSSDGGLMRFNIVLTAGQQLAVDLDAKTVKLNGVNRRNALVGSWIVPAAGMELRFDADSYNPDALMTVQWSDAWR